MAGTLQDKIWAVSDVQGWADIFGWSLDDAATDLGLSVSGSSVLVVDSSDQAKRNRNRAWAIWLAG